MAVAPRLTPKDELVLQNAERLLAFFSMGAGSGSGRAVGAGVALTGPERAREGRLSLVSASSPTLFGSRLLKFAGDAVFGPSRTSAAVNGR